MDAGMMLQGAGVLTSVVNSYYQTKMLKSSLRFQSDMAQINAKIAELGAQSALNQGQREIGALTLRAGQTKSSQRAAMAANGIDLGVGSAAEVQASTDIMKEIDSNTINANAVRSAWGYRVQGANYLSEALMGRAQASGLNPMGSAMSTLIGSAGSVASSWYKLGQAGAYGALLNGGGSPAMVGNFDSNFA